MYTHTHVYILDQLRGHFCIDPSTFITPGSSRRCDIAPRALECLPEVILPAVCYSCFLVKVYLDLNDQLVCGSIAARNVFEGFQIK